MESKDRHKTVHCKFCKKSMLSNKLKRHMKTHKSFLTKSDKEIKEKLKAQRESQIQIRERLQQIEKIAHSMGMSADFCSECRVVKGLDFRRKISGLFFFHESKG